MKDFLFIGAFVGLCVLTGWWWSFAYDECIRVGHSVIYCTLNIGN